MQCKEEEKRCKHFNSNGGRGRKKEKKNRAAILQTIANCIETGIESDDIKYPITLGRKTSVTACQKNTRIVFHCSGSWIGKHYGLYVINA